MVALPTTVQPDYGIRKMRGRRVKEIMLGDFYSQRVLRGPNPTRIISSLTWSNITDAQRAELVTFFNALGSDAFQWTPPGESTPLYFFAGEMEDTPSGFAAWRVTMDVRQVFDVA